MGLWKNAEQNVKFEFSNIDQKNTDSMILNLNEISNDSFFYDTNMQIEIKPMCENGYLNAIDFFVYYETQGYMNAIFEINYTITKDLFNMAVLDSYKMTDKGLESISPQLTSLGYKTDLIYGCGWRVKEEILSELTKYMYHFQLFAIYPNTIPDTELFHVLDQMGFEATGYFI